MLILPRLAQARKKAGLSQNKIAEVLGIPQQQYSRYENGKNEIPVRYIMALCKYYNVSSDWLLGLSDTPDA